MYLANIFGNGLSSSMHFKHRAKFSFPFASGWQKRDLLCSNLEIIRRQRERKIRRHPKKRRRRWSSVRNTYSHTRSTCFRDTEKRGWIIRPPFVFVPYSIMRNFPSVTNIKIIRRVCVECFIYLSAISSRYEVR